MVMNIASMERFPINYAYTYNNLNRAPRPQHCVRAAGHLPINASTGVIEETDLQRSVTPVDQHINVVYHQGRLICRDIPLDASAWFKLVTIANNIHNYNVMLEQVDRGILLKAKKEIFPGEPLMMWFDNQLLTKMNIPLYLEPQCIMQSGCTPNYRCQRCDRQFSDPNPLKIHIALDCNKLDKSFLWDKLAKGYASFHLDNFRTNFPLAFQYQMLLRPSQKHQALPPPTMSYPNTRVEIPATSTALTEASTSSSDETSPNVSINSSLELWKTPVEPVGVPHSAFKPYPQQRVPETIPHNLKLIPHNKIIYNYPPQINPFFQANLRAPVSMVNVANAEERAAQMETIVSNLGKSKNGHHCLYCRRIYSRKYGLKIHIRTHTGYKPLKCKICSRAFGDPSNLNKHVRLHAEGSNFESPYKCDLCEKVFVRRRDVERHMKSRHPESESISSSSRR
ncbi:GSCOCG00003314001-RA-CDS [Cotesia congregata]|nr:GSCOCG00003314001-RA-CDS [Cotesia congregata]